VAEIRAGRIHLEGVVAHPEGGVVLRESRDGDDPVRLGEEVGDRLLARGGNTILEEVYGQGVAAPQQP
jgi:hydroxymethylbilane synthase